MLDVGAWGEFVLILILALIIIGPKDLPKVLYTLGHWLGKIRRLGYDAHTALTILMNQQHPFDHMPDEKDVGPSQMGGDDDIKS